MVVGVLQGAEFYVRVRSHLCVCVWLGVPACVASVQVR